MPGSLDQKIAIVTGGARGLGGCVVDQFAEAGASVVIADVLDQEGAARARTLIDRGHDVTYAHLDVADEASWKQLVASCLSTQGRIDVLVNNAGIVSGEPVHAETREHFDRVLSVNLTGVFLGMKAVIPSMLKQGSGSIINTSSTWGIVGAPNAAAYHASKGGVTVLTKNAAVTYAEAGIRVNSVHPGPMQTIIADEVGEEGMAATAARTPMRRVADPAEVAGAFVYLASDAASFTTGASLTVDGGYTAI